jgi:hypothetical protein
MIDWSQNRLRIGTVIKVKTLPNLRNTIAREDVTRASESVERGTIAVHPFLAVGALMGCCSGV